MEKGWSQLELGKKMNCGQRTISRYELETADLSTSVLIAFCHLFEVSADYILGIEDETGAKKYR